MILVEYCRKKNLRVFVCLNVYKVNHKVNKENKKKL